jgi:4-aminobutyrate aminotransferase-like enzyme
VRYYSLIVESTKDRAVKDVDGNFYIALNSGIAYMNVSHTHPEWQTPSRPMRPVSTYSNTDFYYRVINLAEKRNI